LQGYAGRGRRKGFVPSAGKTFSASSLKTKKEMNTMPRWKPKTPHEKFLAELQRLEVRISAKRRELEELESSRKQLEMVVNALAEVNSGKAKVRN